MPGELRNTRQKDALRAAFTQASRPLSPEEALLLARHAVPAISIATVYRNIASLLKDQWLRTVELPGEPPRYEVAGKKHHHHFHCQACGKVFDLAGCGLVIRQKLPAGFHVQGHDFFLYGSCDQCAAPAGASRARAGRARPAAGL